MGQVSGVAVGVLAVGSLLVWSGIGGRSVLASVQDIIRGKKPRDVQTNPINIASSSSAGGAGSTNTGTTANTADGPTVVVEGVHVAPWFAPLVQYARAHGWTGTLTSGYRSYAEQARIYASGVRPAARPGASHHQGTVYPDGAIDVVPSGSAPQAFVNAVRGSGLQGADQIQAAGAVDPVHISIPGSHRSGEGSY